MRTIPEGNTDLGGGFSYRPVGWYPDRSIPSNAERYAGVPDIEEACVNIYYGHKLWGICNLDTPEVRSVFGPHVWQVQQREPLTLTPSILDRTTGIHGFITNGKWCPCSDSPDPDTVFPGAFSDDQEA